MLAYFRDRAVTGVEIVDDAYTRTVHVGNRVGTVHIEIDPSRDAVCAEGLALKDADARTIETQLRDLLDLDAVPADIAAQLRRDPLLEPLVAAYPGLRVPGCWDVFETVVRAVVGQQVSVKAARTVLGRLVAEYGEPVDDPTGEPMRLFPTPEKLADRDLMHVGLNRGRAEALAGAARRFADDPQFVRRGMPSAEALDRMLGIRGIGPWTANYVLLRGLRDHDAFPAADLGALKASGARNARALEARAEHWRPWRGYALLYLWKSLSTI